MLLDALTFVLSSKHFITAVVCLIVLYLIRSQTRKGSDDKLEWKTLAEIFISVIISSFLIGWI